MTKYDDVNVCSKCGGRNKTTTVDSIDGVIPLEVKTICTKCGVEDYWVTGFFETI